MANNLFVAYDLIKDVGATRSEDSEDYQKIIKAIQGLGGENRYTKLQYSLYFVSTDYSCREAVDIVMQAADQNDSLVVIDVTNSEIMTVNTIKRARQLHPTTSIELVMKHLGASFKFLETSS